MGGRCDQFNSLAMHSYTFSRSPIEFRWIFSHKSLNIFPFNYLGILSLKYVYDFLMWHDCKKSSRTQRWNSMTEDDVLQYAMDKVRKKNIEQIPIHINTPSPPSSTSYPIPFQCTHICVRVRVKTSERRKTGAHRIHIWCFHIVHTNSDRMSEWVS